MNVRTSKRERTIGDYLRNVSAPMRRVFRGDGTALGAWQELRDDAAKTPSEIDHDCALVNAKILLAFAEFSKRRRDVRCLRELVAALEPHWKRHLPRAERIRAVARDRRDPDYACWARMPMFRREVLKLARSLGMPVHWLARTGNGADIFERAEVS